MRVFRGRAVTATAVVVVRRDDRGVTKERPVRRKPAPRPELPAAA